MHQVEECLPPELSSWSLRPTTSPVLQATGTGPAITQDAAEAVLNSKLGMPATSASREVVADVYQYWIGKRASYGKPLLRRFWPQTAADDTNPHMVFRPREKVQDSS